MFDFHETRDQALGFQMTDREIVMVASMNLTSIHMAAFQLLRHSASMEFDLGAIHMAALLSYPETFIADREKAVGWVLEVLDVLRNNHDNES